MDELQRRALARLPMTEGDVRITYAGEYSPWPRAVVQKLCESHERLRAELDGTTTLLRDAEANAARLSAEVERLRGALERISAGVRFPADLAAETLDGGDDDGTTRGDDDEQAGGTHLRPVRP